MVIGLTMFPFQEGNSQDELSESKSKIDRFILQEIEERFGGSLLDIQKNLGPPLKMNEQKTENIHVRGVEETIVHVDYSGLAFAFLKENDLHREFLVETELTGENFDLSWGVRIGISSDRLIEIFGEPDRRLDKNSVYRYMDSESLNWIDFYFKKNVLDKISWIFYVD